MTQPHLRRLDKDELVDKLMEENKRLKAKVGIEHEIVVLIQKYIGSSLKSVENCIQHYPDAKKYQPLMKTRGELRQILVALKGK